MIIGWIAVDVVDNVNQRLSIPLVTSPAFFTDEASFFTKILLQGRAVRDLTALDLFPSSLALSSRRTRDGAIEAVTSRPMLKCRVALEADGVLDFPV